MRFIRLFVSFFRKRIGKNSRKSRDDFISLFYLFRNDSQCHLPKKTVTVPRDGRISILFVLVSLRGTMLTLPGLISTCATFPDILCVAGVGKGNGIIRSYALA